MIQMDISITLFDSKMITTLLYMSTDEKDHPDYETFEEFRKAIM